MMFLTLMLGCTYTVQDWWTDQADGFCTCNFPETYDTCFDQQMNAYEGTEFWDSCFDDVAPVDKNDVRTWYRDFTENCNLPEVSEPTPEDPEWFAECEN